MSAEQGEGFMDKGSRGKGRGGKDFSEPGWAKEKELLIPASIPEAESAFYGELVGYGIDALFHFLVIRDCQQVQPSDLKKIISRYGLKFNEQPGRGFFGHIPKRPAVYVPQRYIFLFSEDYLNRFTSWDPGVTPEQIARAQSLCSRSWRRADLDNPQLLQEAEIFATDMWHGAVAKFHSHAVEYNQPQNLTDLGKAIISYYNSSLQ